MKEVIVKDRHPVKFKSWNSFMSDLQPKIDTSTNKIEYRETILNEVFVYQYLLDYIKARAYDEFMEAYNKIFFDPYEDCQAYYIISEIDKIICSKGTRI